MLVSKNHIECYDIKISNNDKAEIVGTCYIKYYIKTHMQFFA